MSNPRKFSEKIQIQLQKQEEETRLFNEMMQEAQMVKLHVAVGGQGQSPNGQHPHPMHLQHQMTQPHLMSGQHMSRSQHLAPSFPQYRGGSLPNVHGLVQHQSAGIDLHGALETLEALRDPSPNRIRHISPSPTGGRRNYGPNGGRRSNDPYDMNQLYLSPPESNRLTTRAHSDSALHQSANPQLMDHQSLMASFSPNRRSPVPEPNFLNWNEQHKMGPQRSKSGEIPGMMNHANDFAFMQQNGQASHSQQQQQQQQQSPQQHMHQPNHLSPVSIQPISPPNNLNGGSLSDLTSPHLNPSFPPLLSPETEEPQPFPQGSGQPMMSNQARGAAPHSSSASPTSPRRQMVASHQRKPSPHSMSGPYSNDVRPNQSAKYNPYPGGNGQGQFPPVTNFASYRSNSSSPSVHEPLAMPPVNSNPSSPGTTPVGSYVQDPHYQNMQQTIQHKFEQITMEQHGMNPNDLYNGQLSSGGMPRLPFGGGELGQLIPDIIFTGADDHSNFRPDLFMQSMHMSTMNSHTFSNHANSMDPFASGSMSQEHSDLLEQVFKLDQFDIGMLSDIENNLQNMVDPETEEQFRLDNSPQ